MNEVSAMDLTSWFNKGMTSKEYIDSMKEHKENLETIYDGFQVPEEDHSLFEILREKNLRVIALSEDWCGDAMLNVPILLKLTEAAGIETRFLLRDQNLELMDQYLTNGTSRAIPIFIFIDDQGEEKMVWGPRAPMLKSIVDNERTKLPPSDHEDFKKKLRGMMGRLTEAYRTNQDLWQEVYDSIKTTLVSKVMM